MTGASTGCARPMPALGFDPAPGDVGSIGALARRYAEIAAAITAVQTQLTAIDLTRWEGKAATAARARQAALARALAQAAGTAANLGGAAARWSPRLAAYQAEADALERQAAGEHANQQYLTTRAPRVPQLGSDLSESATALAAIRDQAEQLHQEYLATAATQPHYSAQEYMMADLPLHLWPICRYSRGRAAATQLAELPSRIPRFRGSLSGRGLPGRGRTARRGPPACGLFRR